MRFRIHWSTTLFFLVILVLIVCFFAHWRYIDDNEDPLGTVYISEIRQRLDNSELNKYIHSKELNFFAQRNFSVPVLVWWTPFTYDTGSFMHCPDIDRTCFITNIRKYRENRAFSAFLFYGTAFQLYDLPLPRKEHEQWSLLHEESPKNNFLFSFEPIMKLFNHTATFKRQSDLPLTTQWLHSMDDLLDTSYLVDVATKNRLQVEENLAPVVYIQSDCNTPSDRDLYIEQLMKFIRIDSYGKCLHNKDLPEHLQNPVETMEHDEILKLVAKYKFALAFENAICTDYITEKFWRPLKVGTIPVVYGSDQFQDFLPDRHSAIAMTDFPSPSALAERLHQLNENDSAYDSYRQFKYTQTISKETLIERVMTERTWGTHNDRTRGNFISKFECLVCERIHRSKEIPTMKFQAQLDHYGCPPPVTFDSEGNLSEKSGHWYRTYEFVKSQMEVFHEFVDQHVYNFTEHDLYAAASKRYSISFRRNELL